MIPTKEVRDEWRRLAAGTMMTSAVGEYTPEEFTVLLDAADELEAKIATLTAERDEAVRKLAAVRERLTEIGKFAEAHHSDEQSHRWLHGLTVDIPAMVEAAIADAVKE